LRNLLLKFIENKDTDGCVVLTKLVLSFGENQLNTLFEGLLYADQRIKDLLIELLQLIISLSSIPGSFPVDEESSDLTFVFWYTLQDTLLGIDQKATQLQQLFRPIFVNLLEIFVTKLQIPTNYDTEWTDEEKERHRCYRIDIGDTMVYMISLIGDCMLDFLMKRLVDSVTNDNNNWQRQESLIYMLQSVVSELNESTNTNESFINDTYLVTFIDYLPRIKYSNKHILSTTLLAVGSLGSWFERNVNHLPNAISICLLGLKTETVTQSASFALKDIISDCDLAGYSDQIITTCEECLAEANVAQNYEVRLMSIIGLCLSDLFTIDTQRSFNWLNRLVEPYLQRLVHLASQTQVDKVSQQLTCHILNLLSQLMSSLLQRQTTHNNNNDDSSCLVTSATNNNTTSSILNEEENNEKKAVDLLIIKLLPIYKQIINRNSPNDLIIIDKIFESISVTLAPSISSPESPNIIESHLGDIIEMFYNLNDNGWRRYTYDVCRQLISIWWRSSNDKYKPILTELFMLCYQNAIKLIQKDMNWFHDHTDIVEQYCVCLAKLLKGKYYDLFERFSEDSLFYLMRFVQYGLQLPEQYTLRAVGTFTEEFIKFTKTKKHLMEFMEKSADNIVQIVLFGISGALPRQLTDILAGILFIFFKEYPQMINVLLNSILIKNDFQPMVIVTSTASSPQPPINKVNLTSDIKIQFIKSLNR
jgi:hypothetical protein